MPKQQPLPWLRSKKSTTIRKLVMLKEKSLRLTPGFEESRKAFLGKLKPHRGEKNRGANFGFARKFAREWRIPMKMDASIDHRYLAETPFSSNPVLGELSPVVLVRDMKLPMINLVIDVRFDRDQLDGLISSHIGEARRRWESSGGEVFREWDRDLDKWGRWIQVHELAMQAMKTREITKKIRYKGDQSVVSRWRAQGKRFINEGGYLRILPFLNADKFGAIRFASFQHPVSRFRHGPVHARVLEVKQEDSR